MSPLCDILMLAHKEHVAEMHLTPEAREFVTRNTEKKSNAAAPGIPIVSREVLSSVAGKCANTVEKQVCVGHHSRGNRVSLPASAVAVKASLGLL